MFVLFWEETKLRVKVRYQKTILALERYLLLRFGGEEHKLQFNVEDLLKRAL